MDNHNDCPVDSIKIPRNCANEFVELLSTAEDMSFSSFNVKNVESHPANPYDTSPIAAAFPVEIFETFHNELGYYRPFCDFHPTEKLTGGGGHGNGNADVDKIYVHELGGVYQIKRNVFNCPGKGCLHRIQMRNHKDLKKIASARYKKEMKSRIKHGKDVLPFFSYFVKFTEGWDQQEVKVRSAVKME